MQHNGDSNHSDDYPPNPLRQQTQEMSPAPVSYAIKACGNCGSPDVEISPGLAKGIRCNNCGCRTGVVYMSKDEASNAYRMKELIAVWNRRTPVVSTIDPQDMEMWALHHEAQELEEQMRPLQVRLSEVRDELHRQADGQEQRPHDN